MLSLFLGTWFFPQMGHAKKDKKEQNTGGSGKGVQAVIGISPAISDLECRGGEKATVVLVVSNPNPNPITARVDAVGLTLTSRGGTQVLPITTLPANHLSHHTVIDIPHFDLPRNTSKNVMITLNVPTGLTGTQYTAVSVSNEISSLSMETDPTKRTEEYSKTIGVGIHPALMSTIKCNMVGTLKYGYTLEAISLLSAGNAVNAKATYKNTGNAELRFMPYLTLLDMENRVIGKLRGSDVVTIIPGGTQTGQFQPLYSKIPVGKYKVISSIPDEKFNLPPQEKLVTLSK